MLSGVSSCEMWTSSALARVEEMRFSESVDLAERRERRRSSDLVRSSELRILSTVSESRLLGNTVSAALRSSSDSSSVCAMVTASGESAFLIAEDLSESSSSLAAVVIPLAIAKFSTKEVNGSGRSASATKCETEGATRQADLPEGRFDIEASEVVEVVLGSCSSTKVIGDTTEVAGAGPLAMEDTETVEGDLPKIRLDRMDDPIFLNVENDDADVLDLTDTTSSSTRDLRDFFFFSTVTDEKPSKVGGNDERISLDIVIDRDEGLLWKDGGTIDDPIV